MVPFGAMASAKAVLNALRIPVVAVARPGLGHAMDAEGIAIAGDFLRDVLGAGDAVTDRPA